MIAKKRGRPSKKMTKKSGEGWKMPTWDVGVDEDFDGNDQFEQELREIRVGAADND